MKRVLVVLAVTAVTALGAAAPVSAHPGHTSCKPGASALAKAPGPFGQFVRPFAQGTGAGEEVAVLHEIGCRQEEGP
jgi:hypothetical protein